MLKKLISSIVTMAIFSIGIVGVPAALAEDSTIVVSPENQNGWLFMQETATGSGEFVTGPAAPPLGVGSANLLVDATGRELLLTLNHAGTSLSDIDELAYSTYTTTDTSVWAASLQFDVDYDLTDETTSWQGRLVYEPYMDGTVTPNTWQSWNPLEGMWWSSGAPGNATCPQSDPCTWEEVLDAYPNAGIRALVGAVNFKAGGPWSPGFNGNVDAFSIGIDGSTTTYDFEPTVVEEEVGVPQIQSPSNGAVIESSDFAQVNWSDVSGENGPYTYQYQSFSDANYTNLIYSSDWLVNSEIPTPGTPPGTYYIQVRAQDAENNMSDWSNDQTNPYLIIVEEDSPPETEPNSVSGQIWHDEDGDTNWNGAEPPLAGWRAFIDSDWDRMYDEGELNDVSDESGKYTINGLSTGERYVCLQQVVGWAQTSPTGGYCHYLNVNENDMFTGRNFGVDNGEVDPGPEPDTESAVTGYVWNDMDGDTNWNGQEQGVAGRQVFIDLDWDRQYDAGEMSAITSADGSYELSNLPEGVHYVCLQGINEWTQSSPTSGYCHYLNVGTNGEDFEGRNFGTRMDTVQEEQ